MFLSMAVLLGVDIFDSASYVKYARDDRMLFSDGSKELSRISSLPRWSPLYGKFTVKESVISVIFKKRYYSPNWQVTRLGGTHEFRRFFPEVVVHGTLIFPTKRLNTRSMRLLPE